MANNFIPVRLEYSGGSVPTGWAEYQADETMALPGSLSLTGSGRRITADFSAGAAASRMLFQTSASNASTYIGTAPAGTGTNSGFIAHDSSSAANCSTASLLCIGNEARLSAAIEGSGTYRPLTVYTNNTERMRVDTSGQILMGITTTSGVPTGSSVRPGNYFAGGAMVSQCNADTNSYFSKSAGYSNNIFSIFYVSGTPVGSISTNGTATTYATSSDYRLKDFIQPIDAEEATARVMAYRPVTWVWKVDGSSGKGFIAHECQAVDPATATGVKDQVRRMGYVTSSDYRMMDLVEEPDDLSPYGPDASWRFVEEQPVYQGRDDSKMIPDMVAMMQRQEARIVELEARLQQVLALLQPA